MSSFWSSSRIASPTELLDGDMMIWQFLKGEDGRFHLEPLQRSIPVSEVVAVKYKRYRPNVCLYLFSMTRDEYENVFDTSKSKEFKSVVDER